MNELKENFRYDINGLRAYAVLAVTMFHFRVPGFEGGFVGVDVFFVISGFLMTQILVNRIRANDGNDQGKWLLYFYLSRACRILPALIFLCAFLLVAGLLLLLSYDLRKLSSQIVASLSFLSNFKFFNDGDGAYFDAVSQNKFLLHTWSLSVEWQFYLVFPIILLIICNISNNSKIRLVTIFTLFTVSFAISVFITPFKPQFAFYLLPTRAWELLAGSLVFLAPSLRFPQCLTARSIETVGFLLISTSIIFFDETSTWPGFAALLPVLGTSLVLFVALQDSRWTRLRGLQAIGNWSYSIYLWHWPLAVALVYLEVESELSFSMMALIFSIFIGWISFTWVEKPTRRVLSRINPMFAFLSIAIPALIIIFLSLVIHQMNGVPGRKMPFNLDRFEARYHSRRDECLSTGKKFKECIYGHGNLEAILLGDSHAGSMVTAIQQSLPNNGSLVAFSFPGCVTLFDDSLESDCSRFNWKALQLLNKSFNPNIPLLIVNRLDDSKTDYLQNIVNTACIVASSRPVWLVRPLPEMSVEVPRISAYRYMLGRSIEDISVTLTEYHLRHKLVWEAQDKAAAQCGVRILDPLPYICDTNKCSGLYAERPLYYDADHLSEYGNEFLVSMFRKVFATGLPK